VGRTFSGGAFVVRIARENLAVHNSALDRSVEADESGAREMERAFWMPVVLGIFAASAFCLSTKATQRHFDYTYQIAGAFLHGHLGLFQHPSFWLNEMVPKGAEYYSVFPLGAVLPVTPLAALREAGLINDFPGKALATVIVGASVYFFFQLSGLENGSLGRRIMLALFPIFGTWTWCNLGFGGAWQIALGFALLGEAAALYFTLVRPRPFLAGIFFALAFGNRTELILTLPIYLYFWFFRRAEDVQSKARGTTGRLGYDWRRVARFLVIPVALAIGTAAYNFARFHSILDFGYAHIPNLTQEPWYLRGLFSLSAIPWNAQKMLLEGMQSIPSFPYFRPYPFGASIFLSSPFLFLLFREGGRYRAICWIAIGALTLALWCHGNPGGWQFSYRYGIVLLPWMFLLLLSNGAGKISATELSLFFASIAINAVATYQFLWTNEITP
jgi:hypothetical protein